jgi:hypothetical protein
MAIVEQAVREDEARLTPAELLGEIRALGVATPGESAGLIRADRDDDARR